MKMSWKRKGTVLAVSVGLVFAIAVGVVLSGAYLASGGAATSQSSRLTAASGSPEQWAFGGVASSAFSCTDATCYNGTTGVNISLSYHYYIAWVVIYTETNISSTQTMIEGQSAINASASVSATECVVNCTTASPQTLSISLSVSGRETSIGFTNITNGTVDLSAGPGAPATVAAQAIENANSNESFNFSGSYSLTEPSGYDGGTGGGSASFDIGGNEASSVTFATPLGIVPLNPQPGDWWNSTAPFSAHGTYTDGYTVTATAGVQSESESNWTSGVVSPSGTLNLTGTDLGAYTLYDNYTNPATTVTGQEILLNFNNGTFGGADGYLLIPSGLYGGVLGGFDTLVADHSPAGPISAARAVPTAGLSASGETAYYQKGQGFIGAAEVGSENLPIGSGLQAPSLSLTAGPEPVSVAQSQYQAIVSPSSSSSGIPVVWLIVGVVVVVVVIVGVVAWRRSARKKVPPTMVMPPGGAPMNMPQSSYPGMAPPPSPPEGANPQPPMGPGPGQ
jgi:hypothetical protein